jgi:gamma-glutamylcyclotransferase (GGCT)/AIG2-like uncharacterized protein YtfP
MSNRIAVYGSLKKGLHNHKLLESSRFVKDTYVRGFNMYSLGSFPCVVPNEDGSGSITVEVYDVTDEVLVNLDRLEGYPRFYDRDTFYTKCGLPVLMYYMHDHRSSDDLVSSGCWEYKRYNTL